MPDRLLLVEDDPRLAGMLAEYLGGAGFPVTVATTGAEALHAVDEGGFGAMILDLTLPDMDGIDVCRAVRAKSDVAILMLTARGAAADRILGLELGADDYVAKPFEPRELLARVRAILRRRAAPSANQPLHFGSVEIDPDAHTLRLRGALLEVTSYQFGLLLVLARNAGRVLSRDFLMDALQGAPLDAYDRSIDVHVSRLRAVLEDDPKKPRRIITVRGSGYVFAKVQD